MIGAALVGRLGLIAILSMTTLVGSAIGVRWSLQEGHLHGMDCIAGEAHPGRVIGRRCLRLDIPWVAISLRDGAQLRDLQDFSRIQTLTIHLADSSADLTPLLDHSSLEWVNLNGWPNIPFDSFSEMDFEPLTQMPALGQLRLSKMANVDLRFLSRIDGLKSLRLSFVEVAHVPDFTMMNLQELALGRVVFPGEFELVRMETVAELRLNGMPELFSQIPDAFPNLEELQIDGPLSNERALLEAILRLEHLSSVDVWHPEGRTVQGREAVIEFLSERIE